MPDHGDGVRMPDDATDRKRKAFQASIVQCSGTCTVGAGYLLTTCRTHLVTANETCTIAYLLKWGDRYKSDNSDIRAVDFFEYSQVQIYPVFTTARSEFS